MKTTLMWTINDFPTYRMVSGWNMHEKLIYPYCIENNKAFTLTINGKTSFYCHRRFLSTDHKYKKNQKDFFVDRVERDVTSLVPSCEELYDIVSQYKNIVFDFQFGKHKFSDFGVTYN